MRTRSFNPFLPKRQVNLPIRWRKGPFVKTREEVLADTKGSQVDSEVEVLPSLAPTQKAKRPAQNQKLASRTSEETRSFVNTEIGKLSNRRGFFFVESYSSWGSNLDMIPLAHGPVGCSNYAWTDRLNLPEFHQGIDSFTALNACTDLGEDDIKSGGDARLSAAIEEALTLFPLTNGLTVLNEDPIALIASKPGAITAKQTLSSGKLIISLSCESIRATDSRLLEKAAGIKAAAKLRRLARDTSYDVAVPFQRTAPGLIWIVSKLLREIGLNPIHHKTCSSTSDLARLSGCKLIIGFADSFDVPPGYMLKGNAHLLEEWFGIPLIWTCFLNPAATDASLRAIAAQFGPDIQANAERVIASNKKKIDQIIAKYRPLLTNKLLLDLTAMSGERIEPYRLLGMRLGTAKGWPGKTGVWRTPRLVFDRFHPSDKSIDSYVAEAKPDLILYFRRTENDWHKRGQAVLPFTPFFNHDGDAYWGYDGFALLAAALDRTVNAPWRKLVKPPWATATE